MDKAVMGMVIAGLWLAAATGAGAQEGGKMRTYDLAAEKPASYTKERGWGLLAPVPGGGQQFALDLPDGNYDITLTFGGVDHETATVVRAEARRLMLPTVRTGANQTATRTITVNVRDGQLNLDFRGLSPSVTAVSVKPDPAVPTVFIAGDSTVTDQTKEPWGGWGQMLPRFLKPGVAVANYALSGRAAKSFQWEGHLDKIAHNIKAGDYLFIQFAHNDQKPGAAHVEPFTTYKEALKVYLDVARKHGATPVLVTPVSRRRFSKDGKLENTLGDYPAAVRQLAAEEKVALVDLNEMSGAFYQTLGVEGSTQAFVQYPAGTYPGQTAALKDNTHFNEWGAYELARCVAATIKEGKTGLAKFVVDDLPAQNTTPPKVTSPLVSP